MIGMPFYLADPRLSRHRRRDDGRDRGGERRGDPRLSAPRGRPRLQLRAQAVRDRRVSALFGRLPSPTATTTRRSRSRATTCGTCPPGTRRSTRTRTSPRRSRSGSTPTPTGASVSRLGRYPKLLYVDRIVREYGPRRRWSRGADYDWRARARPHDGEHYHQMRPSAAELPAALRRRPRARSSASRPAGGAGRAATRRAVSRATAARWRLGRRTGPVSTT